MINSKYYNKIAFRTSLIYIVVSALWIIFSDRLLLTNPSTLLMISTIKGWFYTIVAGIFFYTIMTMELNRRNKVEIDRKKAESSLEMSENKYHVLVDLAADGILLGSHEGIVIDANEYMCNMIGLDKKDIIGKHIIDLPFTKESLEKNPFRFDLLQAGKIVENQRSFILPNESEIIVEIRSKMMPDGTYQSIYRDITEHSKVEEKIKESEERYRKLFESSKDSVLILNSNTGTITDVNKSADELLGYSFKELIGKKFYDIGPLKNIIDNKESFVKFAESGYMPDVNLVIQTKSGNLKNIEFVSNIYTVGDKKVIQCNIRDITDRIKQEKELDKAKTDFLSLTSHQLRTPLSATKWVLESVKYDKNFTSKQHEKLEYLVDSNERLINLVNDLLDVTKIESGKLLVDKKISDIIKLITDTCINFKILADHKNKVIQTFLPENIKNIYCDPVLTHEALENLLSNAINYSSGDTKEILVSLKERDDDYLISVHNDGIIDPAVVDKIKSFDKFVRGTSAPESQPSGTGLGLYITKKIIEASGGKVWFESNRDSGTTFYITINKIKL